MSALILASTSPGRRAQLEQLGITFQTAAPGVDETPWHARNLAPGDLVTQLALAKAGAVAERFPDSWIVGGDQIAEIDGEILLKPGSEDGAVAQLKRLQGRTHRLHTALAVVRRSSCARLVDLQVTELTMRSLSEAQIRFYVQRDDPTQCAGAYRFESLGASLFECVRGEDPTAIVGLPLLRLTALLSAAGLDVLAPPQP